MKVLFIDTSEKKALVSVISDRKVLSVKVDNGEKTHASNLIPLIKDALKESNLSLKEIDLLGVANGPGSYTGLRIGISSAAAIAFGENKPVITINTLDYTGNSCKSSSNILVSMIDARNTLNYWRIYNKKIPVSDVLSNYTNEIVDQINSDFNDKVTFIGSGAVSSKTVLEESNSKFEVYETNDNDLSVSAYDMIVEKFNLGNPNDFQPCKARAEYFKEVHVTVKQK